MIIHLSVFDANLAEDVVDIGVGTGRGTDDGDLGGDDVGPA